MSRTWAELLGDADDGEREEAERAGFFGRLRDSLGKSRRALQAELSGSFDASREEEWERLEVALIRADVGVPATAELVRRLEARGELADLGEALAEEVEELFGDPPVLVRAAEGPTVVLVVGVNGTGKTTTVGKLARVLVSEDRDVILGAADTFRAAAADQLETWGARVGVPTIRSEKEGADPAAVAFDAVKAAGEIEADVVIIDTAGRLHNKVGLMDELGKVKRVIEKQSPIDEVLLVLDATTGQNGLRQAEVFAEAVKVTGIVLTKLDGTAKGGIVVAVQRQLGVPVKLIGLGEGPDDLAPFDAEAFVDAIVG